MTPERWKAVEHAFFLAAEAPPEERESVLARACDGDAELEREVRELLAADEKPDDVMHAVSRAVRDLGDADTAFELALESADPIGALAQPNARIDGKYRVEQVLGAGGMGVVVEAVHEALGERVAIKLLRGSSVGTETLRARFLREARAAAAVKSPYVVDVRDIGTLEDGTPFMVMERLQGTDLGALLEARGALGIEEAVRLALATCEALSTVHAVSIVHRDLKPANVFLAHIEDQVQLKLLDFGIAKAITSGDDTLTSTGEVFGSHAYMSPEQLRATRDVDERTDVWALGVMLYEMVTGRRPFVAENAADLTLRILAEEPPMEDVPSDLHAVVLSCLAKERDERHASVLDVAQALARFDGTSGAARVLRIARRLGRPVPMSSRRTEARSSAPDGAAPSHAKGIDASPRMLRYAVGAVALVAVGAVATVAAWPDGQDDAAGVAIEADATGEAPGADAPNADAGDGGTGPDGSGLAGSGQGGTASPVATEAAPALGSTHAVSPTASVAGPPAKAVPPPSPPAPSASVDPYDSRQ